MTIGHKAAKLIFRKLERSLEHQPPDTLRGNQVIGQHNTGVAKDRIHLHVLIPPQSVQVRQRLAHGQHRQGRSGARLDDFQNRRILHFDAVRRQMNFGDRSTEIVGNRGLGGQGQGRNQRQRRKKAVQNCFLTLMSSA